VTINSIVILLCGGVAVGSTPGDSEGGGVGGGKHGRPGRHRKKGGLDGMDVGIVEIDGTNDIVGGAVVGCVVVVGDNEPN